MFQESWFPGQKEIILSHTYKRRREIERTGGRRERKTNWAGKKRSEPSIFRESNRDGRSWGEKNRSPGAVFSEEKGPSRLMKEGGKGERGATLPLLAGGDRNVESSGGNLYLRRGCCVEGGQPGNEAMLSKIVG